MPTVFTKTHFKTQRSLDASLEICFKKFYAKKSHSIHFEQSSTTEFAPELNAFNDGY